MFRSINSFIANGAHDAIVPKYCLANYAQCVLLHFVLYHREIKVRTADNNRFFLADPPASCVYEARVGFHFRFRGQGPSVLLVRRHH